MTVAAVATTEAATWKHTQIATPSPNTNRMSPSTRRSAMGENDHST